MAKTSNKNMKKGKAHHWSKPDDQKVAKTKNAYVPTGKPRGRPPKDGVAKPVRVPTGKPKGRPAGVKKAKDT